MLYPFGSMSWLSAKSSSCDTLVKSEGEIKLTQVINSSGKLDVREKQCTAICLGPVLTEHTEVIAANKRLFACSENRITEVLTKLDSLVYETISITEIGTLRRTKMDSEAFS